MEGVFQRVQYALRWRKVPVLLYIPLRCGAILLQMRKLFITCVFQIVVMIAYIPCLVLVYTFQMISQWVMRSRHSFFAFHEENGYVWRAHKVLL